MLRRLRRFVEKYGWGTFLLSIFFNFVLVLAIGVGLVLFGGILPFDLVTLAALLAASFFFWYLTMGRFLGEDAKLDE